MSVWLPAVMAAALVMLSGGALIEVRGGAGGAAGPPSWVWGIGAAAAGVILGSPLVMLGGPVTAAAIDRVRTSRRAASDAVASEARLVELVADVSRGLRSGWPLARAIDNALNDDWVELRIWLDTGSRLSEALVMAPADNDDQRLVLDTLGLLLERGGAALVTVERLAGVLDARAVARDGARTRAAQARASAWLVSALPLAFAAAVAMVDARAMSFFVATWAGAACLVGSVVFSTIGWWWMNRLTEEALR